MEDPASKLRYIQELEDHNNIRTFVIGDLKKLGIKPPKTKKNKSRDDVIDANNQSVFGNNLCNVPSLMIESCGPVPRFLVEATEFLEQHIDTEGLFRKSGSVARQKELKDKIELGDKLQDAHPFDVASLIKQFFRELPDALLTSRFHDTFLKCNNIENYDNRQTAVLLMCLLLPWHHLSTLRFFMHFLSTIAANAEQNKMDVINLALCLAPNLLHMNSKAEKMKDSESKLLQAQTNIVQLLIQHAEDIGMMNDTLFEKAALMGSLCFPSDDELEKSGGEELDESQPSKGKKKKKKRSGSLQGLVSNLSSSFSKWRRESKGHNSSSVSDKSSMLSIMSVDMPDASCVSEMSPEGEMTIPADYQTPKVMRKRKASAEMIPFSASKKKAILQQMPQMSTLGTPYTPAARSRRASGHDFALGTPSIKFTEGSSKMVFTATPAEGGPCTATPRRKMDRILSPSSAMKVKRHTTGKSGCFSPKTPKSGKRRSVKGFFRRLSGSKESQSPGSLDSSDFVGKRLANTSGSSVMHGSIGKKKGGLFRRHKKTPSSPARLVTNLLGSRQSSDTSMSDSVSITSSISTGSQESVTSLEMAAKLETDLRPRSHRRGLSAEGTPSGLKRGKPNTVGVGLPDPAKRRSLDQTSYTSPAPSGPIRHSSQREIFITSPKKHDHLDCSPVAFDTSPIPKAGLQMLDCSPIGMEQPRNICLEDPSKLDLDTSADGEDLCHSNSVSRQISVTSLNQEEAQPNATMVDANITQAESEHERAFIEESMLENNLDETKSGQGSASVAGEDVFKKPLDLPLAKKKEDLSSDSQLMDSSLGSDASDTSVITVIYNGQPVPSKRPVLTKEGQPVPGNVQRSRGEPNAKPGDVEISTKDNLRKSMSAHSVESVDSGLGMENMDQDTAVPGEGSDDLPEEPMSGVCTHQREKSRDASFRALKEGAEPVMIKKRESFREKSRGAGPQFKVSAEMHHMLSRVGVVDEESSNKGSAPFVAVPGSEQSDNKQGNMHESILNLQEAQAGKVASTVKQFSRTDTDVQEVIERHTSPLRFPNSVSRRGTSPVRIPTVFAKADKEAAIYREITRNVMRGSPKSGIKAKPILPISTNLVRSSCVEDARRRLSGSSLNSPNVTPSQKELGEGEKDNDADPTMAGHTPIRHPACSSLLQTVEINESLLDTIDEVCTPKSEKLVGKDPRSPLKDNTNKDLNAEGLPRIKMPMLVTDVGSRLMTKGLQHRLAAATSSNDTPVRKYRQPMKSVKRLKGSPHSPRSPAKSPKRYLHASKPGQLSPIPKHVLDWNV